MFLTPIHSIVQRLRDVCICLRPTPDDLFAEFLRDIELNRRIPPNQDSVNQFRILSKIVKENIFIRMIKNTTAVFSSSKQPDQHPEFCQRQTVSKVHTDQNRNRTGQTILTWSTIPPDVHIQTGAVPRLGTIIRTILTPALFPAVRKKTVSQTPSFCLQSDDRVRLTSSRGSNESGRCKLCSLCPCLAADMFMTPFSKSFGHLSARSSEFTTKLPA